MVEGAEIRLVSISGRIRNSGKVLGCGYFFISFFQTGFQNIRYLCKIRNDMVRLTLHSNTESCIGDIKRLVEQGLNAAYEAVNAVMIEKTYWRITHRGARVKRQGTCGLRHAIDRDAVTGIELNIRERIQRQVFARFSTFLFSRSRH